MFDPVGHVWCKKEFNHTDFPDPRPTLNGMQDLGKIYKKALAGQLVKVMEVSTQEDEYLVLSKAENHGAFLWMVDERDTRGPLIPVIKKQGVMMPAGMDPIEEFKYLAELKAKGAL